MEIQHDKHTIQLIKLNHNGKEFGIALDTFGSPENYDRLLKNIIRILGITGSCLYFKAESLYLIPMVIISLVMAGMSDIRYFRNKRNYLEWTAWR